MSDPRLLLDQVLSQFWDAVAAVSNAAASSASLGALNPLPEYARAPFNGRVLDRIDALALADPVAQAAFALLRGLVPATVAATDTARLHGWDPGGGRPRSIALVLQSSSGPPCDVVIALARAADGGPSIQVVGSAAAAPAGGILDGGASLTLNFQFPAAGDLELEFRPNQGLHLLGGPGGTLEFGVFRAPEPPLIVGVPGGPNLQIHGVNAGIKVTLAGAGVAPTVAFTLGLAKVQLDILPALVASLMGGTALAEISVDLGADGAGIQLAPLGGTRALKSNQLPAQGLRIDGAGVELLGDGPPDAPLRMGLTFGLSAKAPGLPLSLAVEKVGAAFPFRIGRGARFGFIAGDIQPLPPTSISAELALPFASGMGLLAIGAGGAFLGAFDLDLGFVAVHALAVFQPARDRHPLSLAVLIVADFPYPGIQLGFGFSLTAVGGIVAINRRTNFDALEAAVLDGRAAALMSPSVASSNPGAALASLVEIFPEAGGRFVIGPLLQVSWGGRLITLSISLIFDLPNPVNLALLGRLTIAIPDPAVPLILIGVTFLARFDPSIPMVRITGTLRGSHIVFMPLQGDAFVLVQGGRNPNLVISAGGFHPDYPRPDGTPALNRIAFDISPLPVPRMRAEMYFALTANSVQFGAAVYLSAKLPDCGIEGQFKFDALCVFAPNFAFKAQASARVAVEAFDETLIAVSLDILLEGPTPWHVRGRGSISVLWEDISLDFEETWGDPPPRLEESPRIEDELRRVFLEPRNWLADSPGAQSSGVMLRAAAGQGEEPVLHPLGRLQARQQRLPFNVTISRYDGADVAAQRWEIKGAGIRRGQLLPVAEILRDEFPRAHYFSLSESDQLSARSFTQEVSGVLLVPGDIVAGRHIECPDNDFDEKVILNRNQVVAPNPRRGIDRIGPTSAVFDAALGSRRMHEEQIWWADSGVRAVIVQPTQPLAAASVSTLAELALPLPLDSQSEVQAAQTFAAAVAGGMRGAQLVERWEVGVVA